MTHLLDTNACIETMRGNKRLQTALTNRHPNDLGVSMITVFELYSGIALCRQPEIEKKKVERFLDPLHVLPFDLVPSLCAAELRVHLQKRGEQIGPYDLLIAAHALAMDVTLVTHNTTEFARVPELRIEDWQVDDI
jgi:tRNA(fMet)-specific endonuclease VapC